MIIEKSKTIISNNDKIKINQEFRRLGYNIDDMTINSLQTIWSKSESFDSLNSHIDEQINKAEMIIENFSLAIRGVTSFSGLNHKFMTIKHPPSIDHKARIAEFEALISYLKRLHSYLQFAKKATNKKTSRLIAFKLIFDTGENLGLFNDGMIGNGRSNPNKLIKFAAIITGLTPTTVKNYYKKCLTDIIPASQLTTISQP